MSRTDRQQQCIKHMKRVGKMKIFMESIGKMKILKPIPYDEKLSHFRMEDYRKIDYRNYMDTALILNDYDWMDYHLKTFFNTKDYGKLTIGFLYGGFSPCKMRVIQEIEGEKYTHNIYFDYEIFKRNIIAFMKRHIEHWDDEYVFWGLDLAIAFYNDVLENFIKCEIKEYSPDDVEKDKWFWYGC